MKTREVEFQAPAGTVPEGTQAGEEFDLVCTFRVKPPGTVCLVTMGDTPMPGSDSKNKYKPEYGNMGAKMQAQPEGAQQ